MDSFEFNKILGAVLGTCLALLSLNNNAMAVTPEGNQAVPMTKFIGTGPYLLKERRPDQWVILSRFAGSALELADALQVHPYNVEELAAAMAQALAMPEVERRRRMGSLRRQVEEHNVYRWGGRILTDILHLQP